MQNNIGKKLCFLIVILLSVTTLANPPGVMYYQGRLFDGQGSPLEKGDTKIVVKIFDSSSGGEVIWGPQTFENISLNNGYFNLAIGGKEDNGSRSLTEQLRAGLAYIEITADNKTISPRQKLESVPYAMQSHHAEYATHGVPSGVIVMWSGKLDDIPKGWLLCDGENGTPDLKDRFILSVSSDEDPGEKGGDSLHVHDHELGLYKFKNSTDLSARPILPIEASEPGNVRWKDINSEDNVIRQSYNAFGFSPPVPISKGKQMLTSESTIEIVPPYYKLAFIIKI